LSVEGELDGGELAGGPAAGSLLALGVVERRDVPPPSLYRLALIGRAVVDLAR